MVNPRKEKTPMSDMEGISEMQNFETFEKDRCILWRERPLDLGSQ